LTYLPKCGIIIHNMERITCFEQDEVDNLVERCKKVAPWIKDNRTDQRAIKLVDAYRMFQSLPEPGAEMMLEVALEELEFHIKGLKG